MLVINLKVIQNFCICLFSLQKNIMVWKIQHLTKKIVCWIEWLKKKEHIRITHTLVWPQRTTEKHETGGFVFQRNKIFQCAFCTVYVRVHEMMIQVKCAKVWGLNTHTLSHICKFNCFFPLQNCKKVTYISIKLWHSVMYTNCCSFCITTLLLSASTASSSSSPLLCRST